MTWSSSLVASALILAITAPPRLQVDSDGVPVRWNRTELTLDVLDCPRGLSGVRCSDVFMATQHAVDLWTRDTGIRITVRRSDIPTRHVREDGRNTLSIRFYPICRNVVHNEEKRCADPNRYGHTVVYPARQQPGADHREIVEADIELNADLFTTGTEQERLRRLQAVLVHEMGHFLGLSHNCSMSEAERNESGHHPPLPMCNDADRRMTKAVMYPFDPGHHHYVEVPSPEELAFVRQVYPSTVTTAEDSNSLKGPYALLWVLLALSPVVGRYLRVRRRTSRQ